MQYYDLLSSEDKERILNEQLLDKMEEAEEIENSRPTGYARHDDDDEYYEEQRRREKEREREREESERPLHNPYGRRFRNQNNRRHTGYTPQHNNNHNQEKNKKPVVKSYAVTLQEKMNQNRKKSYGRGYNRRPK